MRKTNIDGDAAALLLFQAVGVDAGQGLYQGGLSVIDVSGGADNDGLHAGQYSRRGCKPGRRSLQRRPPAGPMRCGTPTRQPAGRRRYSCDNRASPYDHLLQRLSSLPRSSGSTASRRTNTKRSRQLLGGREPTLTELGIFSVMWSEHCSYKSSRVHLKRLPTRSKLVVQGPGENAGIIDIGDGWACAFKIESHNHPSFIEPFQGAATGVGGILRDIFTMGARPIAVMDSLRFGRLRADAGSRARDAAHNGISHLSKAWSAASRITATASACPTVGGETMFEPCYSRQSAGERLRAGLGPQATRSSTPRPRASAIR